MNKFPLSAILILLVAGVWSGCRDVESHGPVEQLNKEVAAIDQYLEQNNIEAIKHASGIRIVIDSLGGQLPISIYTDPEIEVDYKGVLFDGGAVFAPAATAEDRPVSGYITGWQIVLAVLPEGSKATVYIPSFFGYGTSATTNIPANSTLVFDIDFKKNLDRPIDAAQFKTDTTAISAYLKTNNIAATYDSLGIWYAITDSTDGVSPTWYDQVKVRYTFKKLDGTNIGTFVQEPDPGNFDSRVVDYFNGIQIGLQRMTEGSKATFYVPSGFAFAGQSMKNASGQEIIPRNTNLIVEMELVEVID